MLPTQTYEALYHNRKEAIVAASILAFEALNYSRLFPEEAAEEDLEIYAFNYFVQSLMGLNFEQLKHRCSNVKGDDFYRIEISVLINGEWTKASYKCKVLPPNKYTFD